MGATDKTQYYNLPLFRPTDFTDWLDGGFNQGMKKIDAALHSQAGQINTGESSIEGFRDQMDTFTTSLNNLSDQVAQIGDTSELSGKIEANTTAIAEANIHIDENRASINAMKGENWDTGRPTIAGNAAAIKVLQAAGGVDITTESFTFKYQDSSTDPVFCTVLTIDDNHIWFVRVPENSHLPYSKIGNPYWGDRVQNVTDKTNFGEFWFPIGENAIDLSLPRFPGSQPNSTELEDINAPTVVLNQGFNQSMNCWYSSELAFWYDSSSSVSKCGLHVRALALNSMQPGNFNSVNIIASGFYFTGSGCFLT